MCGSIPTPPSSSTARRARCTCRIPTSSAATWRSRNGQRIGAPWIPAACRSGAQLALAELAARSTVKTQLPCAGSRRSRVCRPPRHAAPLDRAPRAHVLEVMHHSRRSRRRTFGADRDDAGTAAGPRRARRRAGFGRAPQRLRSLTRRRARSSRSGHGRCVGWPCSASSAQAHDREHDTFGSVACTIQVPPGTCMGPFRIRPPPADTRSAAWSIEATLAR